MKITTKDIIKILPLESSFRLELLSDFDTLTPDQKFDMERLLWKAYDDYYNIRLDANLQLAFDKARRKEEKFDKEFYKRVRELTEKEMEEEAAGTKEKVDLDAARKAMEMIIGEIRASKKPKN